MSVIMATMLNITVVLVSLMMAQVTLAVPSWATRDTQKRIGDDYEVVCTGSGPDINIAREVATNQCDVAAMKQLKTTTNARSLTIETETDASLHSEISTNATIKNLRCDPINEAVDYAGDKVTLWLKCRYNLAKSASTDAPPDNQPKSFYDAPSKSVSIATVPPCSSIVIRGLKARTVRCTSNPTAFIIYPEDTEIIVRADGRQPKSILPKEFLQQSGVLNVFLDP